jgi:hypothetical protein
MKQYRVVQIIQSEKLLTKKTVEDLKSALREVMDGGQGWDDFPDITVKEILIEEVVK